MNRSDMIGAFLIDSFSDQRTYRVLVAETVYPFDFSDRFGPTLVGKTGKFLSRPPTRFLDAVTQWARQGKRIDSQGLCIWEPEPQPRMVHLVGRQYGSMLDGETEHEARLRWARKLPPKVAQKLLERWMTLPPSESRA